jgi:hypothetical protein
MDGTVVVSDDVSAGIRAIGTSEDDLCATGL